MVVEMAIEILDYIIASVLVLSALGGMRAVYKMGYVIALWFAKEPAPMEAPFYPLSDLLNPRQAAMSKQRKRMEWLEKELAIKNNMIEQLQAELLQARQPQAAFQGEPNQRSTVDNPRLPGMIYTAKGGKCFHIRRQCNGLNNSGSLASFGLCMHCDKWMQKTAHQTASASE